MIGRRGTRARAAALVLVASALVAPSFVGVAHAQPRPSEGRGFQAPAEERAVEAPSAERETRASSRRAGASGETSSVEERLYLRERPDALSAHARAFADAELERLLGEREGLLVQRRDQAIALLEEFIREEPEEASEMPDALLRLAELRWEFARAQYLETFRAWQGVPEENRGPAPRPEYRPALELYDRILTLHRDFDRYDLVLYMKAYALTELGDAEGALALYHRIVDEFPTSRFVPDAHMAFAEMYFANGDFTNALPEFERVMEHRSSELYDMALFKSAWCLWRLERTTEAATRFRQVLDLGASVASLTAEQRRRLRDLQDEALDSLIQVFTEDEQNGAEDVFRFLSEIGGERYAERVLTRLSLTYMDQARYDQGIEAYRLLIRMSPADARAPEWQHQIASAYAAMDDDARTIEALGTLATTYLAGGSWVGQQTDPEVVERARERVERAIRVRAMRWHELGQRASRSTPEAHGEALNATAQRRLRQAEAGYDLYLEHFGDAESAYNIHFYRAEILFHRLERYGEAGEEYLAAARMRPDGEYTRDALYNAIGAFEHVRDAQLDACQARGGAGRPAPAASTEAPAPTGGSEAPAAEEDPCGETENDRAFSEAIELYVQLFPTDPDLPEILFRQGRLYYDRSIFDPAVRLFGQLLERFPNSDYAAQAGELILDSFNRAQDYGNIEAWARRLKEAPAFQSADAQRRLDTLILQAAFARGEQLAGRGEHRAAAEAFEHAANEFRNDDRARQALYNAGVERQRAGDLGGARADYELLIERYPGSSEGALGAWNGAQMYESIAQFRDAAHFYEAYGARFPEGPRREDALFNAALLRLAASDYDAAVAASREFLQRFPRSARADEVTFFSARAHGGARRYEEAARVYTAFVRESRNVDRNVEAQTRMAEMWASAGDAEASARALEQAVRTGRGALRRLNPSGRYFLAQARYLQGEAVLRRFEAIHIDGELSTLRARLEEKSQLLRQAAEIFRDVVQYRVAEWVTAALFQVGRSYELFASGLRDAPIPEALSDDEEQLYRDQLAYFIVPIEEQALQAYEGGYRTAIELRIYNRYTAELHAGLTRLNDVQYPPLRELGGALHDGARWAPMRPLTGLRRGAAAEEPAAASAPTDTPSVEAGADATEPGAPTRRTRRRRRARR